MMWSQPARCAATAWTNPLAKPEAGEAQERKGATIALPYNFRHHNNLPLPGLHQMILSLVAPQALPDSVRFALSEADRALLLRNMTLPPRRGGLPELKQADYYDAWKKYLLQGHSKQLADTSVQIANVVGQGYGFLSDCAYIRDPLSGAEFVLSCALYVNSDGVINDGKYDIATNGYPFMKQLGLTMLAYERQMHPRPKSTAARTKARR
jgi:hypothetical protein